MPTPIAHHLLTRDEVPTLSLCAARAIRDQWVEPFTRELIWEAPIERDDEDDEGEMIEHIACQDDRAEAAYARLRRHLRRGDEGGHDWIALRLEVFAALCRHVARREREECLQAFLGAARPAPASLVA